MATTIEVSEAASAFELAVHLRVRGVVDISAYHGVGTNRLRISTWPSVKVKGMEALLACIDYYPERVFQSLAGETRTDRPSTAARP